MEQSRTEWVAEFVHVAHGLRPDFDLNHLARVALARHSEAGSGPAEAEAKRWAASLAPTAKR